MSSLFPSLLHASRSHASFTQWIVRLALAIVLSCFCALPGALAATINVDSGCTLPQAITSANEDQTPAGTECEAGDGDDTVALSANIDLNLDVPVVQTKIRVEGGGYTIDGADTYHIFLVSGNSSDLTVNNITLRNGKATNRTGQSGGAVAVMDNGKATITRSRITASAAVNTGGAIAVSNGRLNISNSTLDNNNGGTTGGGIYGFNARISITHVTIENNLASSKGSGISLVSSSSAELRNSIVNDNDPATVTDCELDSDSSLTENVGNLIQDDSCGAGAAATGSPGLASATGSPAYFRIADSRSPALGIGRMPYCSDFGRDQAGQERPRDGCDAGSVQSSPLHEPSSPAKAKPAGALKPPALPVCTGQLLNQHPDYRISVADGLCSGIQFKRLSLAQVGIGYVIEAGVLDAIDVWGWDAPTVEVCFRKHGSTLFLAAADAPRKVTQLDSSWDGEWTCATIRRAGTIVLLPADSHLTTPPADLTQPPSPSARLLTDCMVRLKFTLNFRKTPGGEIMRTLPADIRLTAFQRAESWIEVDYHGQRGWVSSRYVDFLGSC